MICGLHHLTDEGIAVQLFRVYHFAVHNAGFRQLFPDGCGVYVIQVVILLLGVELLRLDKLRDPALYLGPGEGHMIRFSLHPRDGNLQGRFPVSAGYLGGQPCRRCPLPPVFLHVAHDGPLDLYAGEHGAERVINDLLGRFLPGRERHGFRCSGLFLLMEYPMPVRTKFRFMGVDGLFRLVVNGGQGHDGKFTALRMDARDGYIVSAPKLLHILVNVVGGNAAHGDAAHIGEVACGQVQLQHGGGVFRVRPEHLIIISDAVEDQFVRVFQLHPGVIPHRLVLLLRGHFGARLGRFRGCGLLRRLPLCLFRALLLPRLEGILLDPVVTVRDQFVDALCHLRPGELHLAAVFLPQPDALSPALIPTIHAVGESEVSS